MNLIIDIRNKHLIDLKTSASILGLKYHTARKILYNEKSIGCVVLGTKKLWVEDDILAFKQRCYIQPALAMGV